MVVIGIDPGLSGAVAALDSQQGVPAIFDMSVEKLSPTSKTNTIHVWSLAAVLSQYDRDSLCLVERVSAMPRRDPETGEETKMGATSSFNFGFGAGIIYAVAKVYFNDVRLVMPSVWKRHHSLLKTQKDAARLYAIDRYPEAAGYLTRKKDSGRADALLIAKYGEEVLIK